MALVDSNDWLSKAAFRRLPTEATARLLILDLDVQSAQIAYGDYAAGDADICAATEPAAVQDAIARQLHHAKAFVCAMMRIGRVAKDIASNARLFGQSGDQLKLAWRKKSALFESYRSPRDAIEHVLDNEIEAQPLNIVLVNLVNDGLEVTDAPGMRAPVTADSLERALDLRAEIVGALG